MDFKPETWWSRAHSIMEGLSSKMMFIITKETKTDRTITAHYYCLRPICTVDMQFRPVHRRCTSAFFFFFVFSVFAVCISNEDQTQSDQVSGIHQESMHKALSNIMTKSKPKLKAPSQQSCQPSGLKEIRNPSKIKLQIQILKSKGSPQSL